MDISDLGTSLAFLFKDAHRARTALSTEPAQKVLEKATAYMSGLSKRDLGQVVNFVAKSGIVDLNDLKEFEKLLEESGFVRVGHFTPEEEKPPSGKETEWQDKVAAKALARRAEIHEQTVSTEVKTLPEVREHMKALATAQGLHTQELVEKLMVDAINKNPNLVKKGEEYLKRFNGNITAARRYAISQKLSHLEDLELSVTSPSR